ncbi:MAG TPA: hypothetical protein PLZ51_27030, partial [Aggregatilineales bacterium]|nr:hypothetical protein [Aggregatilineales bacterium]
VLTINDNDVVVTTPEPNISVFDPAISKIGVLLPGDLGVTGERLDWVVTVTNIGNATGNNVVVTDTLRSELRVEGVVTTKGTT